MVIVSADGWAHYYWLVQNRWRVIGDKRQNWHHDRLLDDSGAQRRHYGGAWKRLSGRWVSVGGWGAQLRVWGWIAGRGVARRTVRWCWGTARRRWGGGRGAGRGGGGRGALADRQVHGLHLDVCEAARGVHSVDGWWMGIDHSGVEWLWRGGREDVERGGSSKGGQKSRGLKISILLWIAAKTCFCHTNNYSQPKIFLTQLCLGTDNCFVSEYSVCVHYPTARLCV